jgi:NADH-quinone oxidoreductase subunit G
MPTIFIDNKPYDVEGGENLLKTCLGLGFDLPYFCWHPAMHSVGACRQCAVKQFRDEKDTKGQIVMACMTAVTDGLRISIDDPDARKFRASVIEWFMTNHPHDCPVCDEGGECHLQDMTVMTGHTRRRYRFNKRTHRNQDLGPFVTHTMDRCIACYRCTRFYNDYAHGNDFGPLASHSRVYFGRSSDGALESPFAGNLVEICPTGVFTDKSLNSHYTREWDFRTAPSVCVHCSVGCNTIPGERYGTLRRIRNRFNGSVNGYFLCDRGRYGYEFVNGDRRIRDVRMRMQKSDSLQTARKEEAINRIVRLIGNDKKVIGIGSPRASLEANYALRRLVGPDQFYSGMNKTEDRLVAKTRDIMQTNPDWVSSVRDMALCDAVLVLGEDVENTAPILGLAIYQTLKQRQYVAAREGKIPYWDDRAVRVSSTAVSSAIFVATPNKVGLDRMAANVLRGGPIAISRAGFAIAHAIEGEAPGVEGTGENLRSFAEGAAAALVGAERPLIISGVNCLSEEIIEAAANVALSLTKKGKSPRLSYVLPECNSAGISLFTGRSLEDALSLLSETAVDGAIVLENDLYTRLPSPDADRFFAAVPEIIVIDHLFHTTALKADVLLPAATFAEESGTLVNQEGRAQRYFQVFPAAGEIQSGWKWIGEIMASAQMAAGKEWTGLDEVLSTLAADMPALASVVDAAPDASFRVAGMKVAREPQRSSGRTAIHADATVWEPQPPVDTDGPFSFSMEGYFGKTLPALLPRFWSPGWNSPQAVGKFQAEVGGALAGGDPGVRLLTRQCTGRDGYFDDVPKMQKQETGRVLLVPFYHVFGSEELSNASPSIQAMMPRPYIALSSKDMAGLKVVEGDVVSVHGGDRSFKIPVKAAPELRPGIAGIPRGLPGVPVLLTLPLWVDMEKA